MVIDKQKKETAELQYKRERGKFGNNLQWTLQPEGVLYISGSGPMGNVYEEKTEQQNFYEVLPWKDGSKIRKVIIGPGITSIGSRVFSKEGNYVNLKEIILPTSIRKLDYNAIADCPNLETVVIPSHVTSFFAGMFERCPKLTIYTPENCEAMRYAKRRNIPVKDIGSFPDVNIDQYASCPTCNEYLMVDEIIKFGGGCPLCSDVPQYQFSYSLPVENYYHLFWVKHRTERDFHYWVGLDISNGTAWMRLHRCPEKDGKYFAKQISYDELREYAKANSNYVNGDRYRNLNQDNWYEYTLTEELVFYYDRNGEGPYHEETRYGLTVTDIGYIVRNEVISPMAGGFVNSWEIPIGFFADKTIEEIRQYFEARRGYVPACNVSDAALKNLIRTDKYKLEKQTTTTWSSENK